MSQERLKALVLAEDEVHQDLITGFLKEECGIQTVPLPSTLEAARPDFAILGPFGLANPEEVKALKTLIDEISQALGEITIPILFLCQDSRNLEATAQAVGTTDFLRWNGDLDLLQKKVLMLLEST